MEADDGGRKGRDGRSRRQITRRVGLGLITRWLYLAVSVTSSSPTPCSKRVVGGIDSVTLYARAWFVAFLEYSALRYPGNDRAL